MKEGPRRRNRQLRPGFREETASIKVAAEKPKKAAGLTLSE